MQTTPQGQPQRSERVLQASKPRKQKTSKRKTQAVIEITELPSRVDSFAMRTVRRRTA